MSEINSRIIRRHKTRKDDGKGVRTAPLTIERKKPSA
jgi:hypothetical protein